MKRAATAFVATILTFAFVYVLSRSFGPVPPLGQFFDAYSGFWHSAWEDDFPKLTEIQTADLQAKVEVIFDGRFVPHIFCSNESDVYFSMGYIHARDRLWQMDIQTRFTAGRLAEVVGKEALGSDIRRRRLGTTRTVENIVSNLKEDSQIFQALTSYSNGVNYYIDQLSEKNQPFEFKLMNYRPEPWSVEKTVLINLMMADLSLTWDDLYFSELKQIFSRQELEQLYPLFSTIDYPIIPEQKSAASFHKKADTTSIKVNLSLEKDENLWTRSRVNESGFGSNNWVVSGKKTKTGAPILANDPHLGLQIPSLWYEAHLNCPDFNVYGVTLPGAPFVVIGFNEHIAWGMTNGGWDVTDLFRMTFDSQQHNSYLRNGKWEPVEKMSETIQVKNAPDTTIVVEYTYYGPVIDFRGEIYSFQWTGNLIGFGGTSVYLLNRAKNFADFQTALKNYTVPAQNFVYANVGGNIAMTCAGKNPVRRSGLGRSVSNGNSDAQDWLSFTPFSDLPQIYNPDQGYLASANQQPLNRREPYFGWNWPSDYRARRINQILEKTDQIDANMMQQFQTDAFSVQAEKLVPYILNSLKRGDSGNGNSKIDTVFNVLNSWNFEMRKDEIGATIFTEFLRHFKHAVWSDHFPDTKRWYLRPSNLVLERLVQSDPNSKWFDDTTTPEIETRDQIIVQSMHLALDKLSEMFGPDVQEWQWKNYHKTTIPHLSKLPPLGVEPFSNNGGSGTLNVGPGRVNSFGPSWRMIVSMGQPVRAWGVYPGGQSGNPASRHYMDFLEPWQNEEYFPLLFPKHRNDISETEIESTIIFFQQGID